MTQSSVLQIIALIFGKNLVNISCIKILLTSFFSLTFAASKNYKSIAINYEKALLIFALACCMSAPVNADPIELSFTVEIVNKGTLGNPVPKSPVRPPQVTLEDNVLTFETFHPDYTLTLFNEDGEVVYQTTVLNGTDTVVLPSTLRGDYVLTLDFGGSYYFWSEITL